jgi:Zn-dependent M32 family carboxypeptidase
MPGGQGGGSRVETGAIGLIDLIGECTDKEREYVALVKKAEELIAKIPEEKFRRVLTLRYIACESWKTVRDKMGYEDEKSVFRCNGFALRELQKLL